jgi:hypothetical protein
MEAIGGIILTGGIGSLIYWAIRRYLNKEKIKEELINSSTNGTITKHNIQIRIIKLDNDVKITTVKGEHIILNVNTTYKRGYELNSYRYNYTSPLYVYTTKHETTVTQDTKGSATYIVNEFDPTFGGRLTTNLISDKKIKFKIRSNNCKQYTFGQVYYFFRLFGYYNEIAEKYIFGKNSLFPWYYNTFSAQDHTFEANTCIYLIGKKENGMFHYTAIYATPDDIAYLVADNKMSESFNKMIYSIINLLKQKLI